MKYFGSISDDKDLVNKKYVDDLVLAQAPKMSDIADEFDSTKTYSYGDYASHNNHIYKYTYITPTSGTWDDLKWEQIVVCNEISAEGTVDSPLYLQFSDDAQTLFEAASDAAQSGNALYIIDRSSPVPCAFCGSEVDLSTGDTTHIFSGWDGAGSYIEIQVYNSGNTYGKLITKKSQDTFSKTPNMIAPEFDSTVAYTSDTCVRHDGKLYRRKQANNIIAKAWNSADWVEITVGSGMQPIVRRSTVYFGGGNAWSGTGDIKYATIAMPSGTRTTENTKIDLQPTPEQIVQLQSDGVTALLIETIVQRYEQQHYITIQRRACAIGGVPSEAMTIPCTLTEVQ